MRSTTIICVICLFVSMDLSSCAVVTKDPASPLFNKVDVNKDGVVSYEEFSQDMKRKTFSVLDTNGDSVITWEEWAAVDTGPQARKHFDIMDKNGDKRIEFFEYSEAAEKYSNVNKAFVDLDRTRDGSLSPEEYRARPVFSIFTIHF
jgi:Ca2+-binding EF-hand superfamily protein